MTRRHAALFLLTVILLGGLDAGLRGLDAPAPAAAAEPLPAPTAPTPGLTPGIDGAPTRPAPQVAPAERMATSPTPASARPQVGSEGYGPHIERAQASADPASAWQAVRWLRDCASVEQRRTSYELARTHGAVPELMTQLMQEMETESRRCQTVTVMHRAMLPELAARAMRAGIPEAASAYAHAVFAGDLTPDQRRDVADAMRRDAQSGDPISLLNAVLAHEAWGLTDSERLAYLYAYREMPGQPGNRATVQSLAQSASAS